jgi:hypothetical protein
MQMSTNTFMSLVEIIKTGDLKRYNNYIRTLELSGILSEAEQMMKGSEDRYPIYFRPSNSDFIKTAKEGHGYTRGVSMGGDLYIWNGEANHVPQLRALGKMIVDPNITTFIREGSVWKIGQEEADKKGKNLLPNAIQNLNLMAEKKNPFTVHFKGLQLPDGVLGQLMTQQQPVQQEVGKNVEPPAPQATQQPAPAPQPAAPTAPSNIPDEL